MCCVLVCGLVGFVSKMVEFLVCLCCLRLSDGMWKCVVLCGVLMIVEVCD